MRKIFLYTPVEGACTVTDTIRTVPSPGCDVSGQFRLRAVPSPESFVSGQFCFRSVHGGGSSGIAECTADLVFFVFSDPEPFDSGLRVFSREGRVTRCTVNRNVEVYDRLLICLK